MAKNRDKFYLPKQQLAITVENGKVVDVQAYRQVGSEIASGARLRHPFGSFFGTNPANPNAGLTQMDIKTYDLGLSGQAKLDAIAAAQKTFDEARQPGSTIQMVGFAPGNEAAYERSRSNPELRTELSGIRSNPGSYSLNDIINKYLANKDAGSGNSVLDWWKSVTGGKSDGGDLGSAAWVFDNKKPSRNGRQAPQPQSLKGEWQWDDKWIVSTDAQGNVTNVRPKTGGLKLTSEELNQKKGEAQTWLANSDVKRMVDPRTQNNYYASNVGSVSGAAAPTTGMPERTVADLVKWANDKLDEATRKDNLYRLEQTSELQKSGMSRDWSKLPFADANPAMQRRIDEGVVALSKLMSGDTATWAAQDPSFAKALQDPANAALAAQYQQYLPGVNLADYTSTNNALTRNAQSVLDELRKTSAGSTLDSNPYLGRLFKQRGVDVTQPAAPVQQLPKMYQRTTDFFIKSLRDQGIDPNANPLDTLARAKVFLDDAGAKYGSRDNIEKLAAESLGTDLAGNPLAPRTSYSGGYSRPAFNEQPYQDMINKIGMIADASSPIIAKAGTDLTNTLAQQSSTYAANVDKIRADLAALQAQQAATNAGTTQAVQNDLAQQGVNPQVLAAQQQNQQKMQADAAQRQQDYINRIADAQKQSTADATKTAQAMTTGLQGQLDTSKALATGQVQSQLEKDKAAYNERGGGGGGGGGGDMTAAQMAAWFSGEQNYANWMNPNNNLETWAQGFADTLWGDKQRPA
ncbi:hypothetical protein EBZ38_15195, partial [bacterium]|nr:hypothetical protein [bacterium]